MLNLSCSSTKPGDQVRQGSVSPNQRPVLAGADQSEARKLRSGDPWTEGVVNTQLAPQVTQPRLGTQLSSPTIMCQAVTEMWEGGQCSGGGKSIFNYNVVCCSKLTRYEMRRCLPTLGKSWARWEKLDIRVDIWVMDDWSPLSLTARCLGRALMATSGRGSVEYKDCFHPVISSC